MTQADLARGLKKSRSSVNEYETGTHEPRLDVLRQIAKLTGVPFEDFVALAGRS